MAIKEIPILESKVTAQTSTPPDFKGTFNALAASQNNLSAIGAKVAQVSSNQLATQLGYESGKNPHGDLLPSFTEFDKHFEQSYLNQSNAVLSLQGQKILDDAQIQLSKATRMSPQLIAQTNAQVGAGLAKISENAPTAIKGQLEANFASSLLDQNKRLQMKMIGEQKEDQRNHLVSAIEVSKKQAYERGYSGDQHGAENSYKAIESYANTLHNNRDYTEEEARTAKEAGKQAYLNGVWSKKAEDAWRAGKYPEFQKEYAEKKPADMSHEQYYNTGRAFETQVNFLQGMRNQYENLRFQDMQTKIALNPNLISDNDWLDFKNNVSADKYKDAQFKFIQALKSHKEDTGNVDAFVANFSDPTAWANATEKTKNNTFNKLVDYRVQQAQSSNQPISRDMAEVQVAASAGGEIPVFTRTMKNQLRSANPQQIEAAAQKYNLLKQMGAGRALQGLDSKDQAIMIAYQSEKLAKDPITAARDATDRVFNQDPAQEQANKQLWSNFISKKTRSGLTLDQVAMGTSSLSNSLSGLNQNDFQNPMIAKTYAVDLLNLYSDYFQNLKGDEAGAKELLRDYVDQHFGESRVNGKRYTTFQPLEKVLGFQSFDCVPYIHADVIAQISPQFLLSKEMYDKKQSNEYWEVKEFQNKKIDKALISPTYPPISVTKVTRTPKGEVKEDFNVVLTGNTYDQWLIGIEGKQGIRNISQLAPYLGILAYTPDVKSIRDHYNLDHHIK